MTQVLCEVEPKHLKDWIDQGLVTLIDVREEDEFAEGHLEAARLNPITNFDPSTLSFEKGRKLVFYCRSGHRSSIAALKWAEYACDKEAYSLKGGILAWKDEGLPIQD